MPSYQEGLVLLLVGVLLFGRRLPEVGRTLGKTVASLRRGMNEFQAQMNSDDGMRELKGTMRELKKIADAPRVLAQPTRWIDSVASPREITTSPATTPPSSPPNSSTDAESAKP